MCVCRERELGVCVCVSSGGDGEERRTSEYGRKEYDVVVDPRLEVGKREHTQNARTHAACALSRSLDRSLSLAHKIFKWTRLGLPSDPLGKSTTSIPHTHISAPPYTHTLDVMLKVVPLVLFIRHATLQLLDQLAQLIALCIV